MRAVFEWNAIRSWLVGYATAVFVIALFQHATIWLGLPLAFLGAMASFAWVANRARRVANQAESEAKQ